MYCSDCNLYCSCGRHKEIAMAKDYRLEKRKFVIGGIALSIVLIYLIRLFVLQITTDDYKKNADSNAFLNKIQSVTSYESQHHVSEKRQESHQ